MSTGALTYGSLARLSDYRTKLASTASQGQSKATPISSISSQIPTGPVDSRTDQALQWSGLKPASAKKESPQSELFAGLGSSSPQSNAPSYSAPDLDLAYNFASIKMILSYRDALLARSPVIETEPSETPSE